MQGTLPLPLTQEGHHGQAAVLDLGGLQAEGALGVVAASQVEGVKVATWGTEGGGGREGGEGGAGVRFRRW